MRGFLGILVLGLLPSLAAAQPAISQCPPVDLKYLYSDDFKERYPTAEAAYKEGLNLALDKVKEAMLTRLDQRFMDLFGRSFLTAPILSGPMAGAYGTVGRLALKQAGDLVNALKLADALVAADWKTSRDAVGELELGLLAAVFPAAAPLIAAGKVVNAAWQGFNQQLFDANANTLYQVFTNDPVLLTPEGVERFIDEYLFPDEERTALSEAQRRRAFVHEYAGKIGVDLGPATTWHEKRNLLRSVVNRLRHDFQRRKEIEQKLRELETLRADLRGQAQKLRASGMLEDLTRLDSQAQRCAEELVRGLLGGRGGSGPRPGSAPPVPGQACGEVAVKVYAYGRDETDGSGVGWNSYYPNPSFDDDPDRRGSPNARWNGRHACDGDQLCLYVSGLEAPYPPGHTMALGYEVHLQGGMFEDGTAEKTIVMVRFSGTPPSGEVMQCLKLRRSGDPTPSSSGEYGVFLLTNAANGLYVGTEASLGNRTRCEFEGGGTGCGPGDRVTFRRLLGPFASQAAAREALCAAITERRYFPTGIGLKGRWQGSETWYGLWHDSVTGPCLGATTAEPPPADLPPPRPGFGVFSVTNASGGLYLGTEEALRRRTRCSFEGGGTNCKATDVAVGRLLLGPFATQEEARRALCGAITERRVFPLGIGLKGRWQGSETWYGLWDASVSEACGD